MKIKLQYYFGTFLGILIIILVVLAVFFWSAPVTFPVGSMFSLKNGSGLTKLSQELSSHNLIKSEFWFKTFVVLFSGSKGIKAGDYVLIEKDNVITLAKRFTGGEFDLTPIKITLPEGLNVFEMSKLISLKFSKISSLDFINLASSSEGYLFPDTYLFLPNTDSENVIRVMKDNFQKKSSYLAPEISKFGKSLVDIIKMASIVEEEARTDESRRIVAGILWKRLELNMPLQVDASFKYINGKITANLTLNDLKINSPYNSYLYKGLPPTPIANPGLASIQATITPIKTDYLYFLSDKKGDMHYAKTYAEHLRNKELYL